MLDFLTVKVKRLYIPEIEKDADAQNLLENLWKAGVLDDLKVCFRWLVSDINDLSV